MLKKEVISVIDKFIVLLAFSLFAQNILAKELECPTKAKDYLSTWTEYKNHVRKTGKSHPDYELIFSFMLEETHDNPHVYYYKQCFSKIMQYEKGPNKGDFETFKSWVFCFDKYFTDGTPALIQKLKKCSSFKGE